MSWLDLAPDDPFGPQSLPYGVFADRYDAFQVRVGVRVGDRVLDLTQAAHWMRSDFAPLLAGRSLSPLMAAGPRAWGQVRAAAQRWLTEPRYRREIEPLLRDLRDVDLLLPFEVADYVDFYSSEHHATNVGRMFRPDAEPLLPNWKSLPVGYHGRAGTVVVSGSLVRRPRGQVRTPAGDVELSPTGRLDLEAELGFVVGVPSTAGRPVPIAAFPEHVFGVCLVNDWSARDVQAWEYVPLGPFLAKSFATSISAWVLPLDALQAARVPPPPRDAPLLPYLDDAAAAPWGLDITMEVRLNGTVVSRPPCATTYWTGPQQLAHLTVNGATVRTGDLYASGTVSGPDRPTWGSLLELSWGGERPLRLADGSTRTFLEDGDEVVITATAPGPQGTTVGLGEVRGTVLGAAGGAGQAVRRSGA